MFFKIKTVVIVLKIVTCLLLSRPLTEKHFCDIIQLFVVSHAAVICLVTC